MKYLKDNSIVIMLSLLIFNFIATLCLFISIHITQFVVEENKELRDTMVEIENVLEEILGYDVKIESM